MGLRASLGLSRGVWGHRVLGLLARNGTMKSRSSAACKTSESDSAEATSRGLPALVASCPFPKPWTPDPKARTYTDSSFKVSSAGGSPEDPSQVRACVVLEPKQEKAWKQHTLGCAEHISAKLKSEACRSLEPITSEWESSYSHFISGSFLHLTVCSGSVVATTVAMGLES